MGGGRPWWGQRFRGMGWGGPWWEQQGFSEPEEEFSEGDESIPPREEESRAWQQQQDSSEPAGEPTRVDENAPPRQEEESPNSSEEGFGNRSKAGKAILS